MATAPIKSQPLHNFSLPRLRWAHKNHHHHHQDPPHSSHHSFRRRDSPDSDPENRDCPANAKSSSLRTPRKPPFSSLTPCSSQQNQDKPGKDDVVGDGGEAENEPKPWNLRPRKVVTLTSTATSTAWFRKGDKEKLQEETGSFFRTNESVLKSSRGARGTVGDGGGGVVRPGFYGTERQQRKVVEEKRKLWISLSKEEIEEDVYSLTGSRPSRRPKKRPRNIQKQLDNVFPGLYLVGTTVDYYRGHDSIL